MMKKKIVFLTGTRADFGKLKSLIEILNSSPDNFEVFVFATGMHLQEKYGYTVDEIHKCGFKNIYKFINYHSEESMDKTLANTIIGLSDFVSAHNPDLIVIHGDRVETLAGAIVGSLNNILVAHVEGGEISGTIDELIRHSVSKLSHIHFVSNQEAKKRLIQMGEINGNIYVIGSPDIDVMLSENLPSLESTKNRYDIQFENYAIFIFHPVTTENGGMQEYIEGIVDGLIESTYSYIVIHPNNDLGSHFIFEEYKRLYGLNNFKIFPSIRFEYFIVLLKNAKFIIGNSSAGIREAPYFGVPVINIGSRQKNRSSNNELINCGYSKKEVLDSIKKAQEINVSCLKLYGDGKSDKHFYEVISSEKIWQTEHQKQFNDLVLKYDSR